MNKLSKFLVQRAAGLIEGGRLIDALAPLKAAAYFGGGASWRQVCDHLSWRLADLGEQRFQAGDRDGALGLSSLALAAADNVKALYYLCLLFERDDPVAVAEFARRIDEEAAAGAISLREAAQRLRAAALGRSGEMTSPARSVLEARRARHLQTANDAIAQGRTAEAEAHFLALISLAPDEPEAEILSGHFDHHHRELYFAAQSAGEREEAFAQLAFIVALSEESSALDRLIEEAAPLDDMPLMLFLTERRLAQLDPGSAGWRRTELRGRIARAKLEGLTPAEADRQAREAAVAAMAPAVAANPQDHQLRYVRFEMLLALQRYRAALTDLSFMIAQAQADAELDPAFVSLLARNALYLWKNRRYPEVAWAIGWMMAALPEDPKDLFALHGYLIDASAIEEARIVARRLAVSDPSFWIFDTLARFVADIDRAPAAVLGDRPPQGRKLYANMVCWGRGYVALMESCLASLAAPGNFPALAARGDLTLELVIGPDDLAEALALPALSRLARVCRIKVFLFPEQPDFYETAKPFPYVVFGHGAHFTILRARRDGADLIPLNSDVIYADGSFASVADLITDAPRAAFIDGLNAAMTPVQAALVPYWRDGALVVPPRDLCEIAAGALQQRTTECFYDPAARTARHFPTRVVFVKPFGLRMHSFYQAPVYVSSAALALFEPAHFGTPDGGFAEELMDHLRDEEMVHFASSDAFLSVELNDSAGQVYQRAEMPLIDCVTELFQHYTGSIRRYQLFRAGVDYFITTPLPGVLIDDQTERGFLNALQDRVDRHPVFAELGVERTRIRPTRVFPPYDQSK